MISNDELSLNINSLLQDFHGISGIVIRSEQGETCFQHNAQQLFQSASLIKLAILLEYYRQVEHGLLDPLQRMELSPEQIVAGSGIVQELSPGCRLTLQDLATLMIIVSDNTATNMMIDLLGIFNINQTIKAYDLKDTILQRKMYDWEARDKGLENFTSPADMASLLQIFLSSVSVSTASRAAIMAILRKQRIRHKLPAQTPSQALWAHKTGELPGAQHDVGILELGDKRVLVAVLTKELENNEDGLRLIRKIGRIVYDASR